MHQPRFKHLLAAALLVAFTTSANAQEKGLHRLISGGMDGNVRTYVARCLDGTVGTVVMTGGSEQICALSQGGQQRCDSAWTLMQAGRHACGMPAAR